MSRLLPIAAVSTLALCLAAPGLAADYGMYPELRPAYPNQWALPEDDPLRFEAGLRYWYSWGEQDFDVGPLNQSTSDTTHSGEAHFRIDDDSTQSYVKGYAGYAFLMEGDYSTTVSSGSIANGRLGYVGADFGYMPFGNEVGSVGGLIGYLYWNDSPNAGRNSFTAADSSADIAWTEGSPFYNLGFDSEANNLDIHALRLGLTGRAEISDMIDITAEVAAVPYAHVSGNLGNVLMDSASGPFTGNNVFLSSPVNVEGMGYGAMGEVMVGFKPTENMALRVGGRAWYLQGQTEATYSTVSVIGPADSDADGDLDQAPTLTEQGYITTQDNPFSLFRYGLLAELSVTF
ncbi:hypothetical protein [Devosia nitrariae]|uniref:Porin n=1 Tax=Devosia nitrariae TaxID=2071872 RepID=A0ABQ5W507_9HYPH|nr:hypothetical protein [Devosia nitrariae]GLQ55149.1 hypothetical protein GCM10010862_24080 [Devosia nitrariae]